MTQRKDKVSERIKQEVSTILHDEIKDPRIGFITITKVDLTQDLRFAKVFYSVLGGDDKEIDAKEGLDSALKYIRKHLGDKLKIRYTPDITFKLDKSSEHSLKMAEIFDKIEKERQERQEHSDDQETDT